jgi:rare lipoprotein A (peptidoglycan hydrolase)
VSEFIRSLLVRGARYRQLARSFPNKRTGPGLRVLEVMQEAQRLANMPPVAPKARIDHSGRKQTGRASYYAGKFHNRKMADGYRFDPKSDAAASKTLPLGTTAKVTNVQSGRSAVVRVQDRGPHVAARVLDVTPKAADQLDMKRRGQRQSSWRRPLPCRSPTERSSSVLAEIDPDQLQAATCEERATFR